MAHRSENSHVLGIGYPKNEPVREPVSRHDVQFEDPFAKIYSSSGRDTNDSYSSGFSSYHSGGHIVPSGEALYGNRYVSKLRTQERLWQNDTERAVDLYNTTEELRKTHPLNVSAHLEQVLVNGRRQPISSTLLTRVSDIHHY